MLNVLHVSRFRSLWALGLTGLFCVVPVFAEEAAISASQVEALLNKVNALESQVTELQSQSDSSWMTQRRAEEVKSLISDVLADADTRASFAGDATLLTMPNNGIALRSEDGNFLMKFGGLMQARWIGDFRDESAGDDGETGFDLRRTEMVFQGHVFDPALGYALVLASGPDSNGVVAQDVVITYALDENWTVAGGRYFAPFLREELIGGGDSVAVALSYMNNMLSLGRSEGISLKYEDDSVRGHLYFSDGQKADGTHFGADATDYAVTVRGDLKLAGEWSQWGGYSANSGDGLSILLGGAVHVQGGETGDSVAANDSEFLAWTVDGSIENNGWNLYAAVAGNSNDSDAANNPENTGVVAQLGYMVVPDKVELFGRYEYVEFEDYTGGLADTDVSLITVGGNYYMNSNAKLALDVVYALDAVPVDSVNAGLLADSPDKDGQVAVRAQFQLKF